MKGILSKILFVILAIVVLICAFIGLCAVNPDIAQPLKDIAANIASNKKNTEDEAIDDSSTELSIELTEEEPDEESETEDEPETAHPYNYDLTYDDYVNDWDNTVIDDDILNDSDYTEFVDAFLNPTDDEDSFFPEDSSHMLDPQPEIVDIEDEDQAQEIINSVDYGETGEGLEFDELFYPYYHMLNDRCKALYRQLYANALAQNKKFAPINANTTDKEVESAFCCLLDDHPELFWVDISYYFQYDYQGNVIEFDFDFYKNFPDIPASREKFESTAKELASGAEGLGSDYEKELYIHDLIVDKLYYQFNSLDQSAYSSVVQNYTVCAGYARCFQYLMQLLNVPTYNCHGWGGRERHAWNIIKLDDGYHNVDCTWDDSLSNYDYFNLSDAENDSHRRMDFSVYLPKCVSSDYKPDSVTIVSRNGVDYTVYEELIRIVTEGRRTGFTDQQKEDFAALDEILTASGTYEIFGYYLIDLDDDGVDELLFGANSRDGEGDSIIYDIFAVDNGKLVYVADGWGRNRYYLCDNGMIANEGSNGASSSIWEYYSYTNKHLEFVEGVIFEDGQQLYYQTDPDNGVGVDIDDAAMSKVIDKYHYSKIKFTPFTQ